MRRFIIQCYSMSMLTAGNSYDTLASARLFWRYFFKVVKFKVQEKKSGGLLAGSGSVYLRDRENDRSVEFHRTALLAVLIRFPVIVGRNIIEVKDFKETLKDWMANFYHDPDSASEVLSGYLDSLQNTMKAESQMAGDIFDAVGGCLASNL